MNYKTSEEMKSISCTITIISDDIICNYTVAAIKMCKECFGILRGTDRVTCIVSFHDQNNYND